MYQKDSGAVILFLQKSFYLEPTQLTSALNYQKRLSWNVHWKIYYELGAQL